MLVVIRSDNLLIGSLTSLIYAGVAAPLPAPVKLVPPLADSGKIPPFFIVDSKSSKLSSNPCIPTDHVDMPGPGLLINCA